MPAAAIPFIVGGIGAAGSVASGIIGSNAAGKAASAQVDAANNAANLERQSAKEALDFNKLQYGNSLNLMSPWVNTGQSALQRLSQLMGLRPNQGLPPGVINPNAPQGAPQTQIGAGGNGPSFGNPDVMPAIGPGGINSNRFNSALLSPKLAAQQAAGLTPQQVGTPGNSTASPQNAQVGQTSLPGGGFGVNPQLDPNDPTGQFNPGGTGGLGINPAFPNPDIGNFNAGTTATTNQGDSAQVPRTDGGANGAQPGDPADFGSLAQGFNEQFTAPTDVTEQNDPGYKFRAQQGQDAIERSAAARGGLLTGGTAKALSDYNQNSASAEYGNVYNRAASEYERRYNIFKQNQNDLFNRFATLSGVGQTSAGQLNSAGLQSAGNAGNILLTSAGQIGNQLNNAAAARGSGYVGSANAINGAITGGLNGISTIALLRAMQGDG